MITILEKYTTAKQYIWLPKSEHSPFPSITATWGIMEK